MSFASYCAFHIYFEKLFMARGRSEVDGPWPYSFDAEAEGRLPEYLFGTIGQQLDRCEQRESFAVYR
jgi:hypothetical protein